MGVHHPRSLVTAGVAVCALLLAACGGGDTTSSGAHSSPAKVADAPSVLAGGDGDLWPNCWAKDDSLVAAYGDGKGFDQTPSDIGVTRLSGDVRQLEGHDLAAGDQVSSVWSGSEFTRKPTGMACRDGHQYLAVQNLSKDFNHAPTASISQSDDGGRTWQWNRDKPMFTHGVFTTIMFLDEGRDGDQAGDDYVYAYGLDGNWRDSYTDVVKDPTDLYLARVPKDTVRDRSAWRFYTGRTAQGAPRWSADIRRRVAAPGPPQRPGQPGARPQRHQPGRRGARRAHRPLPLHLVDRVHLRALLVQAPVGALHPVPVQGLRRLPMEFREVRRLRAEHPVEVHQQGRGLDAPAVQRLPLLPRRPDRLRVLAAHPDPPGELR